MSRRTIITAGLVVSLFLNVVFFVFAYVQKQSADAATAKAIELQAQLFQAEQEAMKQQRMAVEARVLAEQARVESVVARDLARNNSSTK
jgi:hypothetical protein